MSLVSKIAAVGITAFISFMLIQLVSHKLLVTQNLEDLENSFALRELQHSQQYLNSQLNQVEILTTDWALWDENYEFMENMSKEFIQKNIHAPSLEAIGLHGLIWINKDRTLRAGIMSDERFSIIPNLINDFITQHSYVVNLIEDINYSKTGLLIFNEKIYLISVHNILRGDYTGPSRGWLVMLQIAAPELFDSHLERLDTKTTIAPLDLFTNRDSETVTPISTIKIYKEGQSMTATKHLSDIYGKFNIALTSEMPREIIKHSKDTFNQALYIQLVTAATIGLLSFIYLRQQISSPLSALIRKIENAPSLEQVSISKKELQRDEIGRLKRILRYAIDKLNTHIDDQQKIQEEHIKQGQLLFELANNPDLNAGHLHQSFYKILSTFVKNSECERATIWIMNKPLTTIECYACYSESGNNIPNGTVFQTNMLAQNFMHKLMNQRTFTTHLDRDVAQDLTGFEVSETAILCPILVNKQMKGTLIVEFQLSHQKAMESKELFLASLSELCSNSIYANERKKLQEQLNHMAHHDSLTGLPNRSFFNLLLDKTIARSGREKTKFALLFIDLDKFKPVNDQYGHAIGDQLLIKVAERLSDRLRESDTLARLGGDEFLILLDGMDNQFDSKFVAKELLDVLQRPFEINEHIIRISCSIGISVYPDHGINLDQLIIAADHAMYQVKNSGRGALSIAETPKTNVNS